MNGSLANLVYACLIAGLFYLNYDKSVRTSKALWLPVFYLFIIGSRPVSVWLGQAAPNTGDIQMDGSPVDAAFFQILLLAGLCVLVHRGRRVLTFLGANWAILLYFLFCLASIFWSDYPGVAFKRWIKAVEDLVMILIIVTDEQPVAALSRLFSRLGFTLVPLSLLFIKYYPALGRAYDQWTGRQFDLGVTNDKNMLGVITFVLLLGAVWRVLALLRSDESPPGHRRRFLLAQGTLLALGISVLITASSTTSSVSFAIGTGLMLATSMRFMRRHTAAVHVLVLTVAITSALVMLLGGGASAAQALGKDPTLTGRTDIWAAVIPMAPNPVLGAGFESFWLSPTVHQKLWEAMPGLPLNEAHDGYIEVYLELGWVGLCLIGLIFISGYRRSVMAFRQAPGLGSLMMAYILIEMVYSITEAGFRELDPIWIFFLLSVIESSSIAAGASVGASLPLETATNRGSELPTANALAMKPQPTNYSWKIVR